MNSRSAGDRSNESPPEVEALDEQHGKPVTKSMIRLKGCWLKQAGFDPGEKVEVALDRSGQLIIRRCTTLPDSTCVRTNKSN